MGIKFFYVFVKRDDGAGWKSNKFDIEEEAKHFAELWREEGKEVYIKEITE